MKMPRLIALAVVLAGLASCGRDSGAGTEQVATPPPAVPDAEETGDMGMGREWVMNMLDENEATLAAMREELELIRRELDRNQGQPEDDRIRAVKKDMVEKLDRKESELRKLNELADEMRQVMEAEKH